MDNFGYIGISLFMFPLWLYIYLNAKRLRLRMRNIGIYVGVLTIVVQPIFVVDYWNPPPLFGIDGFYAIEDFLFSFLSAGIAIAIYNYLFKIKYKEIYPKRKKYAVFLSLGIFISFLLLTKFTDYNAIFVLCYSLLFSTFLILLLRKDLWKASLFTAVFMMLFFTFIYMVLFNMILTSYWSSYWKLIGTPYEYYILNIPWTEYLYYFSLGFHVSIIYDFASGTAKK